MIYADHAASAPMRPGVIDAMLPFLRQVYGNPSSVHSIGRLASDALEAARSDVASIINCSPEEVVFTSGGTEADNLALGGIEHRGIVTSSIEHLAILNAAAGADVTVVDVDSTGRIDEQGLELALTREKLCSVAYANNEIGTIQPIAHLAEMCRSAGAILHTDAVQAPGWLPIDVQELGVDAMTLSAHKFGGPKGIGCLYIRNGTAIRAVSGGGSQERHLRPGTQDVASAVGMAVALSEADQSRVEHAKRVADLRDRLIATFTAASTRVRLTGHRADRLANHASFVVDGINGETLLVDLDMAGVACSSGSACSAASPEASHVLTALGVDASLARNAIRFTFGADVTQSEIDEIAKVFLSVLERLSP